MNLLECKTLKKAMLIMLCLMMFFSTLSFNVSAEGEVASIDGTLYPTLAEAVTAANAMEGDVTITLLQDITFNEMYTINGNITIDGDGHTLTRFDDETDNTLDYTGGLFTVNEGKSLILNDLTIDGNNEWVFNEEAYNEALSPVNYDTLKRDPTTFYTAEAGAPVAKSDLILVNGSTTLNNTTIKNNYAENVGNDCQVLQVNGGASVTLNGATITHCAAVKNDNANGGMIYVSGGELTINEGTVISDIFAEGEGCAICVYGVGTATMNGGEITNIRASGSAGLAVSLMEGTETNLATFIMNGGKIHGNSGASGSPNGTLCTFKNSRIIMYGGEISGNYSWRPAVDIGGGSSATNGGAIVYGGSIINNTVLRPNDLDINFRPGRGFVTLYGGEYSTNVDSLCAPGYIALPLHFDNDGEADLYKVMVPPVNIMYSDDMTKLLVVPVKYDDDIVIPEGVKSWNINAFNVADQAEATSSHKITIPASMTYIAPDQLALINYLKDEKGWTIEVDKDNPVYKVNADGFIVLSDALVSLSASSYTYDRTAKTPEVTVTLNGTALIKDTDYSVEYFDNTNPGTATVKITGLGSYAGTEIVKTFTIHADASIGDTLYPTLAEAVTAANAMEGDVTITLLQDITFNEMYTINGNITIDGEGYTLTRGDAYKGILFTVNSGKSLILNDLTIDGNNEWVLNKTLINESLYYTSDNKITDFTSFYTLEAGAPIANNNVIYVNGGKLTLNNSTIQNNVATPSVVTGKGAAVSGSNKATITFNNSAVKHCLVTNTANVVGVYASNSEFIMNDGSELSDNFGVTNALAVGVYNGAKFTMNGGEIKSNYNVGGGGTAMMVHNGTVSGPTSEFIMNGGRISENLGVNASSGYTIYLHTNAKMIMNGGEIVENAARRWAVSCNKNTTSIEVYDGYFNNLSVLGEDDIRAGSGKVLLYGGEYASDVSEFCALGYIAQPFDLDDDGEVDLYKVVVSPYITYNDDMTKLIYVPYKYNENIVIPEGVKGWEADAFNVADQAEATSSHEITIPASMTYIENNQLALINYLKGTKSWTIEVDKDNPVYKVDASGYIVQYDISDALVSLSETSYTYDGTEKTPDVTVTVATGTTNVNTTTLTSGTDYTVQYIDNIEAGIAKVKITGIGSYSGIVYKPFNIGTATSTALKCTKFDNDIAVEFHPETVDDIESIEKLQLIVAYYDMETDAFLRMEKKVVRDFSNYLAESFKPVVEGEYARVFIWRGDFSDITPAHSHMTVGL